MEVVKERKLLESNCCNMNFAEKNPITAIMKHELTKWLLRAVTGYIHTKIGQDYAYSLLLSSTDTISFSTVLYKSFFCNKTLFWNDWQYDSPPFIKYSLAFKSTSS